VENAMLTLPALTLKHRASIWPRMIVASTITAVTRRRCRTIAARIRA
jgi:hypothetical protein